MAAKYAKIGDKYYTVGDRNQLQQITETDIVGRRGTGGSLDLVRKEGDLVTLTPEQLQSQLQPNIEHDGRKPGEYILSGLNAILRTKADFQALGITPPSDVPVSGALGSEIPFNQDFSQYLKETSQTFTPNTGFSGSGIREGGLPKTGSLGYFKLGTDVFENTGGGQSRRLTEPEFQKLGINYNLLGEGLPMTKTLEQVRDIETKQLISQGGKLGEPSAAVKAGIKPPEVPKPPTPPAGGTGGPPPDFKAETDNINNQANADQDAAVNAILDEFGKNVDVSKSTDLSNKLLTAVEGILAAPAPEKPKSMADLFTSKKAELGVDKLETDLNNIDAQIRQLDADFASSIELEEGKLVSTREISRNIGQNEVAYNRRRRDLLVEKDIVGNQLNNKLNTLEMVMNFTGQDFTNASNYYNQQFTRNMNMLNLVLNLEEREQTRQDKVKNEAQANLTTIYNLFDKQNIKYDSLSTSQKTSIEKLEMSAGLPRGISSLLTKSAPNLEIKATTSRTDASGNTYYDVLMVDPKTNALSVKSIFRGKEEVKATEGDKDKALTKQMFNALSGKKGSDGYVSPNTWNSLRKGWIAEGGSAKTFDAQFSQFINPTHSKDYFTSKGFESEDELEG